VIEDFIISYFTKDFLFQFGLKIIFYIFIIFSIICPEGKE